MRNSGKHSTKKGVIGEVSVFQKAFVAIVQYISHVFENDGQVENYLSQNISLLHSNSIVRIHVWLYYS